MSDPSRREWICDPDLGGLYVLHIDGDPVAATSVVDPRLSHAEQIEQLAQVSWLPPQQLSALFTAIDEGKMPAALETALPHGRRAMPILGGFAATIDADEPPSDHPVRRYLFPDVERSGELALDADERVIATWQSFLPVLSERDEATGASVYPETHIPANELKQWHCALTSKRVVYLGPISPPLGQKSDYPSVFVPPVLSESIAAFRQIKRWATRGNLRWGFHVRHEWLSAMGFGNIPDRKRPLLVRRDDTMFMHATVLAPGTNRSATFELPYKQAAPAPREVAEQYIEAVRAAQPQVTISAPRETQSRQSSGNIFSSKQETKAVTTWTIDGTCSWTLPPAF